MTGEGESAGHRQWGYCINSSTSQCTTDPRTDTTTPPDLVESTNEASKDFDWKKHILLLLGILFITTFGVTVVLVVKRLHQSGHVAMSTGLSAPTSMVSARIFDDPLNEFETPPSLSDLSVVSRPQPDGPDHAARDKLAWLLGTRNKSYFDILQYHLDGETASEDCNNLGAEPYPATGVGAALSTYY